MTAEIVNLKQFRKTQARSEKARLAEQNRISFGRSKSEKQLTAKRNDKAAKTLDAGHIVPPADDD